MQEQVFHGRKGDLVVLRSRHPKHAISVVNYHMHRSVCEERGEGGARGRVVHRSHYHSQLHNELMYKHNTVPLRAVLTVTPWDLGSSSTKISVIPTTEVARSGPASL